MNNHVKNSLLHELVCCCAHGQANSMNWRGVHVACMIATACMSMQPDRHALGNVHWVRCVWHAWFFQSSRTWTAPKEMCTECVACMIAWVQPDMNCSKALSSVCVACMIARVQPDMNCSKGNVHWVRCAWHAWLPAGHELEMCTEFGVRGMHESSRTWTAPKEMCTHAWSSRTWTEMCTLESSRTWSALSSVCVACMIAWVQSDMNCSKNCSKGNVHWVRCAWLLESSRTECVACMIMNCGVRGMHDCFSSAGHDMNCSKGNVHCAWHAWLLQHLNMNWSEGRLFACPLLET